MTSTLRNSLGFHIYFYISDTGIAADYLFVFLFFFHWFVLINHYYVNESTCWFSQEYQRLSDSTILIGMSKSSIARGLIGGAAEGVRWPETGGCRRNTQQMQPPTRAEPNVAYTVIGAHSREKLASFTTIQGKFNRADGSNTKTFEYPFPFLFQSAYYLYYL